jgi:uncharacterized protein
MNAVVVGSVEICLRLEGCNSLKEKRHVIRPLIERARRDFQVAVAEVEDQDLWGNATIGAACVSNDVSHAESVLQHVVDSFEVHPAVSVEWANKQFDRT